MTMMRKMTEIFPNQMKIIEHFCVCGTIVILKAFHPLGAENNIYIAC